MAVEQGTATFYCQCLSCDSISWRVNGTAENRINSPNISTSVIQQIRGGRVLSIRTLLEFNQTTVECVAIFYDGTPPLFTPAVTLLIQGLIVYIIIINIILSNNYNNNIVMIAILNIIL